MNSIKKVLNFFTFCLGRVGGDGVEDVDQDKEERDEERHPPGDDVRRNHEADPRHHHKQACGSMKIFVNMCPNFRKRDHV